MLTDLPETHMSDHLVCLTFDFDTVALWLAMGQTTPTPISRGEFGVVAAERLVKLLDRYDITSTWFVPGLTIDTFEGPSRAVAEAGHEIGHHGYDHVAPQNLSRAEENDQLARGNDAIARIAGRPARGYRSPAWDLSAHSVGLLLQHGFVYDSSMMGHDYLPYRARRDDVIEAGKVPRFGPKTSLWELPVSWSVDDFPHFEYFRGGGLRPTSGVVENWLDDFDYLTEHYEWGVLTYTCHPFVIGRGHRMKMLEHLLEALLSRGARFVTAEAAVAEYAHRSDGSG
jgi:peptidoglycan/xylan/chitin deacetylase (PgdA/CDA1 family)